MAITVSELNNLIKNNIKKIFIKNICIEGEISGYKKYNNTIYANLKDDTSSINIIKFRCSNLDNFNSGDLVQINGNLDFYIKNGQINFLCSNIIHTGEGNILKELEILKEKYKNLGYFNNKKEFPKKIKSLGIITAKDGAALQDILFVLNSNKFTGHIYVKNSPVQGIDCPKGICTGIKYFNDNKVDLIMITRGGGSIDDLMGFSHPSVIEEIAKSKIFTMSAVGHEIDNMISDYIADIRAPTPSIGAEIICKNCINYNEIIKKYKEKLDYSKEIILNKITSLKLIFFHTKKKMYMNIYQRNNDNINKLDNAFIKIILTKFTNIKNNIDKLKSNIEIMKHNDYNAIIIKNNTLIKNIDEIQNGTYTIKINGKTKKIKIEI